MNYTKKTKLKLMLIGLNTAALLILVVLSLAIFANRSLGWFTMVNKATPNGISVSASEGHITVEYAPYENDAVGAFTTIDESTAVSIAEKIRVPDDIAYFALRVTAQTSVSLTEIKLVAPTADEERSALTDEDGTQTYYLGTQIYAKASADTALPTFTEADTTPIYTLVDGAAQDTVLWSGESIMLAPGESAIFTVAVTFKDSGENQDVYKNFGANATEACSRRIHVTFLPNA